MTASIPGLQLIAFMALLAVVVLASLMFFVESGDYVAPGTLIELEGGSVEWVGSVRVAWVAWVTCWAV